MLPFAFAAFTQGIAEYYATHSDTDDLPAEPRYYRQHESEGAKDEPFFVLDPNALPPPAVARTRALRTIRYKTITKAAEKLPLPS
jgi:hypothetical protein